jgi:hypothetical protein
MAGGVDADRQAAGNRQSGPAQRARECPGRALARQRGVAASHHRQLRCRQAAGIALDVQQRRSAFGLRQQWRIQRTGGIDQADALALHPAAIRGNAQRVRCLQCRAGGRSQSERLKAASALPKQWLQSGRIILRAIERSQWAAHLLRCQTRGAAKCELHVHRIHWACSIKQRRPPHSRANARKRRET